MRHRISTSVPSLGPLARLTMSPNTQACVFLVFCAAGHAAPPSPLHGCLPLCVGDVGCCVSGIPKEDAMPSHQSYPWLIAEWVNNFPSFINIPLLDELFVSTGQLFCSLLLTPPLTRGGHRAGGRGGEGGVAPYSSHSRVL